MKRSTILMFLTVLFLLPAFFAGAQISGPGNVCAGSTVTLTATPAGGTWSSSNPSIATVGSTGVVGGVTAGIATISYTTVGTATMTVTVNALPSLFVVSGGGTYCAGSAGLHVNLSGSQTGVNYELLLGGVTTGVTVAGTGGILDFGLQTAGGSYTVVATNATTSCTRNMVGSTTITVAPLPVLTCGASTVCIGGTLAACGVTPSGGTWTSSSLTASVGSSSGIVTGVSHGTAIISYTSTAGCTSTSNVTVTTAPCPLTLTNVCSGGVTTFTNCISGGLWSSSNTSIASIGSLTGTVTGGALGTATISYSLGSSACTVSGTMAVTSSISPITGPSFACVGSTATLSHPISGGTWSSSAPGIATVSGGVVSGVSTGVVTITYGVTGCTVTKTITVNATPAAILGPLSICVGDCGTETNSVAGGVWSVSTTVVATIGSATGMACGITSGTSTITYSIGGCIATKAITVFATPTTISGSAALCVGTSNLLSNGVAGGTWSSGSTPIATIGSTGIITGVSPGITTVSYTLPSGCATAMTVSVSAMPAAITGPSSICVGDCVPETNSVAGGVWSNSPTTRANIGSATGIICGISPGAVTITYTLGSCAVTKAVTVFITPSAISGSASVCVGLSTPLGNSVAGGTWSSGSTSVATIGSTGILTGIAPGMATISYTLPSGCATVMSVTVHPTPSAITGDPTVCTGNCSTYINAVSGGLWSSSSTATGTIHSVTGIFCGITAGTTNITYTLGGCTAIKPVTVTAGAAPITGTTNVCVGSSITLSDAVAGGTWGSADALIATVGSGTGVVTGVATGTVAISYAVGSCPPAMTAIIVNDVMPISGPSEVCVNDNIPLTDGSLTGSWSSSATGIATITPSGVVRGITAGVATITYMMPTGCFATKSITVNPLPAALTGPASVCAGQTITLGPGTLSGGTWSSSLPGIANVSSTGDVSGVSVGHATISYTFTSTGCASTKTVSVFAAPPSISGADDLCTSMCATYTALPGGTWSTSSGPATIGSTGVLCAGTTAGTTIVSYTTPVTGCVVTKPVNIVLPPAAISGPAAICAYTSATLTNTTPGGTWTSGNPVIASIGSASGLVTGNTPGVATISYTRGCPVTRTITVSIAPPGITGSTLVCTGTTTYLSNPLVGGRWYSSDTMIATVDSMTGVVTGMSVGAVIVTYALSNGCYNTAVITVNPGIAPITGFNRVCIGTTTLLSDATPSGVWVSSTPGIATVSSTGVVTGIALGTATISYVVGGICPVMMTVSVNATPGAITGTPEVCEASATTLSNSTPGGIWTSGSTAIATVNSTSGAVTGITAGTADITYTMGAGCETSIVVTVNPLPLPISGINNVCATNTFALTDATPGGTWSSSAPTVAPISPLGIVTGLAAGTATISYTAGSGCAATHPVTINPNPGPILGGPSVCLASTTTLSNSITGGTWSTTSPAITIGSSTGSVYGVLLSSAVVTYTLPAGCLTTATVTVAPLPTLFTVTGGGSYCGGGTGVHIGLSGSVVGTNYFLRLGSTAVGSFPGTGSSLDFGLHTVTGTYTVTATSASTTCSVAMTGSASVGITPFVTPSVTFSMVPSDTVCSGATVVFTPIPANGGTAPSYRWSVNGITAGVGATYSYIPADGDIVKVKMTSSAVCPLPDTATHTDTMHVIPFGTPMITLIPTPNDSVCQGTPVTVNAIVAFGGSSPDYRWMHNGAFAGSAASYSFVPNDNDEVFCILTSNHPCRFADIDTSNKVVFNVDTPKIPSVVIGALPGSTIERGLADTLFVITDAQNPTYQWYINGFPIAGATTDSYISSSFTYPVPDSVSCQVTSNGTCVVTTHKWIFIRVIVIDRTGTPEIGLNNNLQLSPNPNNGSFIITGESADDQVSISVVNMLGQTMYSTEAKTHNGKLAEQVVLPAQLANGMYMLSLHSASNYKTFHIQVVR